MAAGRAASRIRPTPGHPRTSSGWTSRRRSRWRSTRRTRARSSPPNSPDVPFRFSVNPCRGCQHACAYCYARPTHQHLGFGAGTDFDARIVIKRKAAAVLERELARKTLRSAWQRGEWLAFSGVTDCYQPLEAGYGLTRACLEACLEARVPVGVVTKGALVRREADLLARLGAFGERMGGGGPRWEAARALFELSCRRLGLETGGGEAVAPPAPGPAPLRAVQRRLFE